MTRKRKTIYPPPKTSKRPPPTGSDDSYERPNLATVNLAAAAGRPGLSVGDRVRIEGSGLYSGELAVIERISAGAIPSAFVRTANGTRQVRTIDLTPEKAESQTPEAPKPD